MTVSKDQAQMIAALAIACRPHRAPTWDEAGIVANIAKVKDRTLAEVVLAVIRAAADREAVSPGVIPSNGTHWQEQLKPAKWEPTILEPSERCGICARRRDECERAPRFADDDHAFEPDFKAKRPAEAAAQIVTEIRSQITMPDKRDQDTDPSEAGAA